MDEINDLSKKFLCCCNLRDFHLKINKERVLQQLFKFSLKVYNEYSTYGILHFLQLFVDLYNRIRNMKQKPVLDISWDEQKEFLLNTVLHPLVLKYPLSYPFQRSFLRTVIHGLESSGVEVHDDVYHTYTNLLEASTTEYAYKHFVLKDDVVISLKESSRLISDGSTGLHSWEAALVLAEWCLQNEDKFNNKCVVELGSGAGLLGLAVSKCCRPKSLRMTDCHPTVLSLLKDNLLLNFGDGRDVEQDDARMVARVKTDSLDVGVMNVSWEEIPPQSPLQWPEVLLAADVVYDSSLFAPLCGALAHYLHPTNTTPPLTLVACTERNEDTLQEFIQMLDAYRIHTTVMETPSPKYFTISPTEGDPPVKILRLTPARST